jgi:hypothetical protein
MAYNRYKIPPNFNICQLHIDAALPFYEYSDILDRCPCCDRCVGRDNTPICIPTRTLIKIGEDIPLYFMYIRMVALIGLLFAITLVIQYLASETIQ